MPLGGLCEKTALAGGLALEGAKTFGSKALSSGAGQFAYNLARSKVPLVGGLIGQSGTGLASALGYNAPRIKDSLTGMSGSFKMTTSQPAFKPQSTVKLNAANDASPSETPNRWHSIKHDADEGARKGLAAGGAIGAILGSGAGLLSNYVDYNRPTYDPLNIPLYGAAGGGIGGVIGASLGGLTGAVHGAVNPHAKHASGDPAWHRYANAASYGAFMLPYLSERIHDNHNLTTGLNALGLLGLGLTSADKVRHGDAMSLYDVGGLGVMGAGMIHSALRPQQAH